MITRVLGIKIATAVLATSLAVGGTIAGTRNAAPSVTPPAIGAAQPARVEGVATPAPSGTPQPISRAGLPTSQSPTPEPPAQPAPPSTAAPPRPLAGLFPFLRPSTPRTAGSVDGAGIVSNPSVPRSAVTAHSVAGLVLSVSGNTIVLRRQNGSGNAQVIVRPATVIRERGRDVPIADIRPGDRIVVIGVPEGDGSLAARAMEVYPRARPAPRITPRQRAPSQ